MHYPSKELVKMSGKVAKVIFNRPDNGYTVMQVEISGNKAKIMVVGNFPVALSEDDLIQFEGSWQNHPTHGKQFFADTLNLAQEVGAQEKLFIHQIDGVGPSFANKLQQAFGDNLKDILENSPHRLKEVPGIGQMRFTKIMDSWAQIRDSHDAMLFLTSRGIGFAQATKIHKQYGEFTVEKLTHNPYRMIDEVEGVGFVMTDNFAKHLAIEDNDPRRLLAGMAHVLALETRFGHCGMIRDKLLMQSANVLKVSRSELEAIMNYLIEEKKVIPETVKGQACLFEPVLWQQEQLIAHKIKVQLQRERDVNTDDLLVTLKGLEKTRTLSKEQYQAIAQALNSSVFVLTGGPGVGKTTSVNTLVEIFNQNQLRVALCAPTGRAAKRLTEATQNQAKTIHRLLEYDSFSKRFKHNQFEPLPVDVLIIDEASMLDVPLCAAVLQALPEDARLILVGDVDQLSSVGPGEVLRSLITSNAVPYFALTQIFRQATSSQIVVNAHRVNQGLLPETDNDTAQDFYRVEARDTQDYLRKIATIVGDRLPSRFGFSPFTDIQVISPMNIGPLGINNINKVLQQTLNPKLQEKEEIKHYDGVLREGDKVIQLVNNYDKNVFNGDIGTIAAIYPTSHKVVVDFEQQKIEYQAKEIEQLQLAYAITVHKSQGSEYKAVVVVLSMAQKTMLKRNLLYTAITRGKQCVVLLCEQSALVLSVNTHEVATRINKLEEWLQDV
ncbi:MAG: ATP-dependent RecD-like DNA helicase [Candidatus Berkiella sp.]